MRRFLYGCYAIPSLIASLSVGRCLSRGWRPALRSAAFSRKGRRDAHPAPFRHAPLAISRATSRTPSGQPSTAASNAVQSPANSIRVASS